MVFGRFKEAVSDVAETIRQAFKDPACHAVSAGFTRPGTSATELLEAACIQVTYAFVPAIGAVDLAILPPLRDEPMRFEARMCSEQAWSTWAAGAVVCEMTVFRAGQCGRLAVPALPRMAVTRKIDLSPFRSAFRTLREPLTTPGVRSLQPKLAVPKVCRNLDAVLALPIAIAGEDLLKMPKALSMRYTFQLVKATGENIRNLEVLGVFPVPVKGVASLRHDPRSGRILVNLNQEAVGARRGRFILARKKDDRSFVSCFVEE